MLECVFFLLRAEALIYVSLAEELRGLRDVVNMDKSEHHHIDQLKKIGLEKGRSHDLPFEVGN